MYDHGNLTKILEHCHADDKKTFKDTIKITKNNIMLSQYGDYALASPE